MDFRYARSWIPPSRQAFHSQLSLSVHGKEIFRGAEEMELKSMVTSSEDFSSIPGACQRVSPSLCTWRGITSWSCRNSTEILKISALFLQSHERFQLPSTGTWSASFPFIDWGSWQRRLQIVIRWVPSAWQPVVNVSQLPSIWNMVMWSGTGRNVIFYYGWKCFMGFEQFLNNQL